MVISFSPGVRGLLICHTIIIEGLSYKSTTTIWGCYGNSIWSWYFYN